MAEKIEKTPLETLMQDIGLALLKFSGTAIDVNTDVTVSTEVVVEKDDEVEVEKPKSGRRKSTKKAEPEPEPEESDDEEKGEDDESELTREELEKKSVRQLRTIAEGLGYDKDDVKAADKESLIVSILEDDEDDDDDDDESEETDSTDELVKSLEKMTLTAVKKVARDDHGFKAADYKGLDKDAIIEMIVEKLSDSDIEDDDEDDTPYEEDELQEMSMGELKSICKEWGIKMKVGEKKQAHIDAILDAQEEDA